MPCGAGGRRPAATLAISDNDIPRRLCCRSAKFPQERHRERERKRQKDAEFAGNVYSIYVVFSAAAEAVNAL